MTMPKATVYEESDLSFRERKIGAARNRKMPVPSRDTALAQKINDF
jgi:hypothetical protein